MKEFENVTKSNISNCLLNWEKWNSNEIINWIFSLENGKYKKKYSNVISQSIIQQNIKGKHLPTLTKVDLQQSWNINDYQDRIDLLKHIELLCQPPKPDHDQDKQQGNINIRAKKNDKANVDDDEDDILGVPPVYNDYNFGANQIEGQNEVTNMHMGPGMPEPK